jgi:Fe-S oxidoreductase
VGIFSKIGSIFGKTLFFPGCLIRDKYPEIEKSYKKLLQDSGVFFHTTKEEFCCGKPLLDMGYREDFDSLRAKNLQLFKKMRVKKIITPSSFCYETFKEWYDLPVEFALEKINVESYSEKGKMAYHDPCILSKHNLLDHPRHLLKKAGVNVEEFEENRKKTYCCGANGAMNWTCPETSKKVCKERINQSPSETIVTSCVHCYDQLINSEKKVFEISKVISDDFDNSQT